jgi:HlyD family secretion protein
LCIVKKLLLVLLVTGVLLAGLAYWISAPRRLTVSEDLFTFTAAQCGDMRDTVSATGNLQPTNLVVVGSEVPGTVVQVRGEVNQTVTEGDVLVKLDDSLAQLKEAEARDGIEIARAAVAQAEALRLAAEKALAYQRDLEKMGGFRQERDKAEVQLVAAEAGVRMAEARLKAALTHHSQALLALKKLDIKVPASLKTDAPGTSIDRPKYIILEKNVQVGQLVGPSAQAPMFTLAGNLSKMEIHTEVVQGDIGKLRKGLDAFFTISSYSDPDRKFKGTVHDIRPLPNNVRGAVYYNAVIKVDNEENRETGEWRLRPGMTASVDIILRRQKNVWKVPMAALNFQMEDAYQSPEAREHLAEWKRRPDWNDWRTVWIWQESPGRVWPVFVRVNDAKSGKTGIQDGEFHQVLEWEPGILPATGGPGPRLITGAPPAEEPGFFDRPANIKLT